MIFSSTRSKSETAALIFGCSKIDSFFFFYQNQILQTPLFRKIVRKRKWKIWNSNFRISNRKTNPTIKFRMHLKHSKRSTTSGHLPCALTQHQPCLCVVFMRLLQTHACNARVAHTPSPTSNLQLFYRQPQFLTTRTS